MQSPIPRFLSMIQSSRLFIAFSTTYKISESKGTGAGRLLVAKQHYPFYHDRPLWKYAQIFGTLLNMFRPGYPCLHSCRLFIQPGPSGDNRTIGLSREWELDRD
jgi:hypothetical protein